MISFFKLFKFVILIQYLQLIFSSQYFFTSVRGGGCPYTASWLLHVDCFQLLYFDVHWFKMEAINWDALKVAKFRFQFIDEDLYFTNHMSQYEHYNRKKHGYSYSENVTEIYSKAAFKETCKAGYTSYHNNSGNIPYHSSSLALIPFYGGRPPNVTSDLKVNSLGQGNSLVKAEIKVIQTVAAICSILNHLGRLIVGVVRQEDKKLLLDKIHTLPSFYRDRIFIKLISNLSRPANLPFGLVMWAKIFVLQYQCHHRSLQNTPHHLIRTKRYIEQTCPTLFASYSSPHNSSMILLSTLLGTSHDAKEISNLQQLYEIEVDSQNIQTFLNATTLMTHIYYTESDQLLYFQSSSVRDTILKSLNVSVHIIGRRKEKYGNTNPREPFNGLYSTRHLCGNGSEPYILDTERDYYIRRQGE